MAGSCYYVCFIGAVEINERQLVCVYVCEPDLCYVPNRIHRVITPDRMILYHANACVCVGQLMLIVMFLYIINVL